jgi:hypothetical protein
MASKTKWLVSHACGHQETHDLGGKPADKRAGYAAWLARTDCRACWQASRTPSKEWLAEQAAELDTWETTAEMPPLEGSEKAVTWGRQCRHDLLVGAYSALVTDAADLDDDSWLAQVEIPARRIGRASWWIDNRDTDTVDILELLEVAQGDETAGICENPA